MTLTPRIDGSYQSKITFITGSIPLIEENGYFVGNASVGLKIRQRHRGDRRRQQCVQRALSDPGQRVAGDAGLCRTDLCPAAQLVRAGVGRLLTRLGGHALAAKTARQLLLSRDRAGACDLKPVLFDTGAGLNIGSALGAC